MNDDRMSPASRPAPRGERWLVIGLVLVALALHLFYVRGPRVVWGDEPFYLWLGRNWLTGRGYQFLGFTDVHHPPLYPLMSGLLYLLTRDLEVASNILYLIFGPLLVVPMYGIGRRLYGPRAGLLAGLLVALWPCFNASVPWWGTMTEPPFYFFAALALWAAVVAAGFGPLPGAEVPTWETTRRGVLRQAWPWGLVGLASGLAYLTRPEGIFYFLALGGALILLAWLSRWPWRRWGAGLVLLGAGFLLAFVPYAIHTRVQTGSWMVSEKVGITFQVSQALARADLAEHDRILWHLDSTGKQVFFFSPESFHLSMWDEIRGDPRRFGGTVYRNVRWLLSDFFTIQGYLPVLLPLLGLGLFGAAWSRSRWRGELLLLAMLVPPLTFLLFFVFVRYVSPLLLPLILWTALGLERLGDWLESSLASLWPRLGQMGRRAAWLVPAVAVAGMLLFTHPWTFAATVATQAVRVEHRAAGEWLASHAAGDAVVMARYPAVAFHADRHWIPSPNSDYPSALRYAAANGADYWVVDAGEEIWRPQLAALARGTPPPELELVYTVPTAGRRVYVYRIR